MDETATAASPAKVAQRVQAATSPVAKAVVRAVRVVVTDATAVVDAVGVVVAAVPSAKAERSASVLTPKASPCLWRPTYKPVANKPQQAKTQIAMNNAPIALPVSAVNVAVVVDAAVESAMRPVSATSSRVQKAVPMRQLKAILTITSAMRVNNKPAKAEVKDAKAVKIAMVVAVAMDVVRARTAKAATMRLAKTPSKPSLASLKPTTGLL